MSRGTSECVVLNYAVEGGGGVVWRSLSRAETGDSKEGADREDGGTCREVGQSFFSPP